MDHAVPKTAATGELLGSCHSVPLPSCVAHGFVNLHITRGHAVVQQSSGTGTQRTDFRPLSPLYDLNNSGVSGCVLVIPSEPRPTESVVSIAFFNDSSQPGEVEVIAGGAFAVASNQPQVVVRRALPAKAGTSVVIVFVHGC